MMFWLRQDRRLLPRLRQPRLSSAMDTLCPQLLALGCFFKRLQIRTP